METTYGKRIYTKVNRPDRALVEAFRGIPSSNIADTRGYYTLTTPKFC